MHVAHLIYEQKLMHWFRFYFLVDVEAGETVKPGSKYHYDEPSMKN